MHAWLQLVWVQCGQTDVTRWHAQSGVRERLLTVKLPADDMWSRVCRQQREDRGIEEGPRPRRTSAELVARTAAAQVTPASRLPR